MLLRNLAMGDGVRGQYPPAPAVLYQPHGRHASQLDSIACGTGRENLNPKLHAKEKPKKIFSMSK